MRPPHWLPTIAVVYAVSGTALAQAPSTPTFIDETASSGVTTVYDGEWFQMVGGGVAAFDCNADGFADILLPGGSGMSQFYRNTSSVGGPITFELIPGSGAEFDSVAGGYPADIDSDGITDLIVLRVGENIALRGLDDCRFERANEAWGFDGGDAWTASFAATWEKDSAWPTVAIGNYIDRQEEISPWGSCTPNWLHRPDGSGTKFAAPLPLDPSFCPLSMLFSDWNRSGTPSLRVSNDREYYEGGQEQMWVLEPGAEPRLLTAADGWKSLRIWGMGIASYDLDGDRYPEYFLTSMGDNKLQMLTVPADGSAPRPDYRDVAAVKGVAAARPYTGGDRRPSTAWHTQFEDVNNDGLVDLLIVKGNVAEMPDFAAIDPNNLLLQTGEEGRFVEAGLEAGISNNGNSRGGALYDFNLDGLLDLVVTNRWKGAQVWRNASRSLGNWIELKIKQPQPNNDAIGAWISVTMGDKVLSRELTVGGGHAGGILGWVHFGLGGAAETNVTVTWPDGTSSEWTDLAVNEFYVLERGAPAVRFAPGT
jgi:enediyne biosynthesis protein E4